MNLFISFSLKNQQAFSLLLIHYYPTAVKTNKLDVRILGEMIYTRRNI